MTVKPPTPVPLVAACGVLAAIVFLFDVSMPLGVAAGVP